MDSEVHPRPSEANKQSLSRVDLLAALTLLLGTLALLLPALPFDALGYDDSVYLHGAGHVKRGLSWEGFQWALQERHFVIPVPLTWLSLMATTSLLGDAPWGYRLVNILLHAANVLLVFGLARRLRMQSRMISLLVAVVFAWHPTRLESVIWIAERKDVLSIFFLLLTLHGYLTYAGRRSLVRYALYVFLPFVLSLASKPSTVVIPALLMLMDFAPLRRVLPDTGPRLFEWADPGRLLVAVTKSLPDKVPLFLIAFTVAGLTWSNAAEEWATISWERFTLWERLAWLPYVYGFYLYRLFVPLELGLFIPHPFGWPPWPITLVAGCFFALAMVWAVWMLWRERLILVGLFWFFITLLPVSGLFQNGDQLIAFRYTYLAYVGLTLSVALTTKHFWQALVRFHARQGARGVRTALFVVVGIGVLLAIGTRSLLPHWRNNQSIWDYTLLVTGENPTALSSQSSAAEVAGLVHEQLAKARRAFELDRTRFEAFLRMADGFLKLGEIKEAERAYGFAEPILVQWLERNGYDISGFPIDQARLKMVNLSPARLADRAGFAKAFLARAVTAALMDKPELAERFLWGAVWSDYAVVWSPYGLLMIGQLSKLGRDEAVTSLESLFMTLSRHLEPEQLKSELDLLRLRAPALREVTAGVDFMQLNRSDDE